MKYLPLLAYTGAIVATNAAFSTLGPVFATFVLAGLTLAVRDWVHEVWGWKVAFVAVLIGAGLSALVADPAIAVASLVAFLVAETLDLLVYSKLRKHGRSLAVAASGTVGSVIDSLVFLTIAFGSLDFMHQQVAGKIFATIMAAWIVYFAVDAKRQRIPA